MDINKSSNVCVYIYWDRGEKHMPPMIKYIYEYNKKQSIKYNFNLILLTDINIYKYITPHFRFVKLKSNFKSDVVRYYILHKYGGIWLDTDILIIKDMNIVYNNLINSNKEVILDIEYGTKIGCCSLVMRSNSTCSKFCYKYVKYYLDRGYKLTWDEIGPLTVENLYKKHSDKIILNNSVITKSGCNFICWNSNPGYNKKAWLFDNALNAQSKAKLLLDNKECYYIITWTIYKKNNIEGDLVEFIFNNKKSVFYYLVNNIVYKDSDKYLLCIISCLKNKWTKKVIKNSWLNELVNNKINIDYLFIYGNLSQNEEYILNDNELHIKCDDSYMLLNEKTTTLWKYLNNNNYYSKYTKIIKCDDDNFIHIDKFINLLINTTHIDYFGIYNNNKVTGQWKNLSVGKWRGPFYEGPIYWFSKDVLKYYCDNITKAFLSDIRLEDKLFSDIVRNDFLIKPYKGDIEFIGYPIYTNFKCMGLGNPIAKMDVQTFNNAIVISNIKSERVFNYFKDLYDNERLKKKQSFSQIILQIKDIVR